uniref:RING-type domain-containing protein n=1 Tax=Strigamia maritima TaxID=126957 RepID=T1IVE8_STRMM
MFNCESCLLKLPKYNRFSCGHTICHNCIFVDENRAVCPLDKMCVQIEADVGFRIRVARLPDFGGTVLRKLQENNNLGAEDQKQELKKEERKKSEIISEDIKEVKKGTYLVKFAGDKLLSHKRPKDIVLVKLEEEDAKCFIMEKFIAHIDQKLENFNKSLHSMALKLDTLQEKQEMHLKRYKEDYSYLKSLIAESENKIKEDLPGSKYLSGRKIKPGDKVKKNFPERKVLGESFRSNLKKYIYLQFLRIIQGQNLRLVRY